MNMQDIDAFAESVVTTIRDALDFRIGPLEQRVAALEGTPLTKGHATKLRVKFHGAWQGDRLYQPNDAVNHAGKLLVCRATHVSTVFDADQVCWQRP